MTLIYKSILARICAQNKKVLKRGMRRLFGFSDIDRAVRYKGQLEQRLYNCCINCQEPIDIVFENCKEDLETFARYKTLSALLDMLCDVEGIMHSYDLLVKERMAKYE
jgi:hypothetical protein